MESIICITCKTQFPVYPEDAIFYEKFAVSRPRACPSCRARHRLAFKNERSFYKRACDKCRKFGVSMYSPNKPYTVWCYECWFGEDWDPLTYGQEYDPNRPFMEQFRELWRRIPKVALIYVRSINSDYVNISADNKNCYMLVESSNNENCTHCYWIQQCRDLVDVSFSHQTELSYECDDCYNCYNLQHGKSCHDCRGSYFLRDCVACSDCVACVGLRSKKYHIFNKPYAKEDYEKALRNMRLDTHSGRKEMARKFSEFCNTVPAKYAEILNAPGSTGNYIKNAKNCFACFHCYDSEDCRYNVHVWRGAKDCMDCDTAGRKAEMIYNSVNAGIDTFHYVSTFQCWSSSYIEYSFNCLNSQDCFGCVGLCKKQYCILNRQYGKEEYEKIKKEIVARMKEEGTYGDFFPLEISPFGYNESAAQEQFPLTRDAAIAAGFQWEDQPRGTYGKETIGWEAVPDSIRDFVSDNIAKAIFACVKCAKNYLVIPDELTFYQKLGIPLPRLCPDCRHERRFMARGPNKTQKGICACQGLTGTKETYKNGALHVHGKEPCGAIFETALPTDRSVMAYCEACYNAEIA